MVLLCLFLFVVFSILAVQLMMGIMDQARVTVTHPPPATARALC